MVLPYIFVPYFILDFPLVDNVFKLHHALATIIFVFQILAKKITPLVNTAYAMEYSTPLWFVLMYLPKHNKYKHIVKLLFFATFYVNRIQNYGIALYIFDAYSFYPYGTILFQMSLYSLYLLNLVWFTIMFNRLSFRLKPAAVVFMISSVSLKLNK